STARAIGHYARFIRRGAKRVGATSSDPLLLVSAFRDDTQGGGLVLVAINNAQDGRTLNVSLTGAALAGMLSGEQSTAASVWKAIAPASPSSAATFSFDVPAESVTTIAATTGGGSNGSSGSSGGGADATTAGGDSGAGGSGVNAGGAEASAAG